MSATPATSGASGPTTTRSTSSERTRSSSPSASSTRTGWQRPRRPMPGFPGAACSSPRDGACASFHARACSRPPEPTTRTFTARVYGAVGLKGARSAHLGVVQEPGLDRHEWESEWASLEEGVRDDPAGALPYLDDLVARMLTGRGYDLADAVARGGEDREVVSEFLAARDVTLLAQRGEDPDPGDVAAAV